MRLRPFIVASLLSLAASPCLAQQRSPVQPEMVPGEFIVKWRSDNSRIRLSRVAGRRVTRARALTRQTWVYRLEQRTHRATRDALASLERLPDVEFVEPNYVRRPFLVPNDPYYKYQWNIKAVNLEQAWNKTTGKSSIVVAVVDTGILFNHPDLKGRLLGGYDFVSSPNDSGDGNGWDKNPQDNGTESKNSSAFHGTHVAGIIGAASNNKLGLVGVDWRCRILPVRALGVRKGLGNDADIVSAIRWAAGLTVAGAPANKTPAKVINLSFGGAGYSSSLHQAIAAAQANGAIVVAAAGNDKKSANSIYPAAFKDVVTVGAVQYNLKRAPYSNFGSVIDIMAPGGNVGQVLPGNLKCEGKPCPAGVLGPLYHSSKKIYAYHFYDGTSQAAPMVAGVVALMRAINPSLNGGEVIKILRDTANPVSKCKEGCGAGLLNAFAAVKATSGGGGGSKLPFSSSCTGDAQCAGGLCRDVGAGKVCTRSCQNNNQCPSGSACKGKLCLAVPNNNNNNNNGTVTGSGIGGCAVAGGSPGAAMALLLLLALGLRRRGKEAVSP